MKHVAYEQVSPTQRHQPMVSNHGMAQLPVLRTLWHRNVELSELSYIKETTTMPSCEPKFGRARTAKSLEHWASSSG